MTSFGHRPFGRANFRVPFECHFDVMGCHNGTRLTGGVTVGAVGVAYDGGPERLDGGSVDQTVHPRLGLAALVTLERAEDLVLDGRHPFFPLFHAGGLKVPDFIIQGDDLELVTVAICQAKKNSQKSCYTWNECQQRHLSTTFEIVGFVAAALHAAVPLLDARCL